MLLLWFRFPSASVLQSGGGKGAHQEQTVLYIQDMQVLYATDVPKESDRIYSFITGIWLFL